MKGDEALRAEREAILRQLALLGPDSGDEEEVNETEQTPMKTVEIKTETCESGEDFLEPQSSAVITIKDETTSDIHERNEEDEEPLINNIGETCLRLDRDEEKPDSANGSNSSMSSERSRSPPVAVEKVVMDRIDVDKNTPLPEGWTLITHLSGMPVYYHKHTRVVVHSRPYQVEGVVRDNEIPVSTIPCLYRQMMDERHEKLEGQRPMTDEEKLDFLQIPESERKLTPEQYRKYCEKRFKFKTITVHRYENANDRQGAVQKRRLDSMLRKKGFELDYDQLKKNNAPGDLLLSSKSGACLIDLTPAQASQSSKKGGPRKPYLLNPMNKTTGAVLNEFVQRLAKGTLVYDVEDTRNVSTPYRATAMLTMKMSTIRELAGDCKQSLIVLSEMADLKGNLPPAEGVAPDFKRFAIGSGVGSNKKTARLVAAKNALSKIIPKLRISEEYTCDGVLEESLQKGFEEEATELFKKVKIDNPNLAGMCSQFAIAKPYNLLKDAVSRAVRWNGMELKTAKEMVGHGSQLSKVVLELGDMEVEAEAIGVKAATQLASQLLLKKMHPDLPTYGSFLALYGRREDKKLIENAKKQHGEVVRLRDTGNLLQPNTNVLDKLSEEMKNIVLVHPSRRYLYGLEPHSSGIKTHKVSEPTQTEISYYQYHPNLHPNPMIPPQNPYFFASAMQPILPVQSMMHQSLSSPSFIGAPPPPSQDYQMYQHPTQFYHQQNPRKRGHPGDQTTPYSYTTQPRPPPHD